ncbi:hypothetical protein [Merismopedia glauca]|uniref:Uncharacterized protein n=1 Tax=Merismopedia glauca CCAP 1448/3 TaxID=1296344 RepID=A0A2T1C921_9CYAN|nr:hypothetical protein [Merismopedia glauca]PSB04658.1 hypothetical protein C7B64_02965 [Merismopedia glauca CCAP 1448/3]
MKIIRVVHANTAKELEVERQAFILQNYDLEEFLVKYESEIIREARLAEIELAYKSAKNSALKIGQIMMRSLPVTSIFAEELLINPKSFIRFSKIAILTFLQDLQVKLEDVEVLPLEVAKEKYPSSHNLSTGTYTLHPRDGSRLTRLEYYHRNLAQEKDDELIVLLGKMGAKSLKILESDIQDNSISARLQIDAIAIDANSSMNLSKKIEKGKELIVNFEGNATKIESSLLENSLWFSDDSKLHSIFESRLLNSNRIEEYVLKTTYTETFDFDFSLATKYLTLYVDLKAEYQSLSRRERFFYVKFG